MGEGHRAKKDQGNNGEVGSNQLQIYHFINRDLDWEWTGLIKVITERDTVLKMKGGRECANSTERASAAHKTFGVGWMGVSWVLKIKEQCSVENRTTHVSLSSCENHDNRNHCDFKLSVKFCSVLSSKVRFAAELPVMTVLFFFIWLSI